MRSLEEVPEVWESTGKSKEEVSFGVEKSNVPSKNRPKSDAKWGRARKNGLRRAKNERAPSKIRPKSGPKWRKARKTEISGRKRWGGGEAKKWDLLPILQCHEVAKLAQMKFFRIFFRRSLAGNAEMPYLCTRNREATLLQERVTL